jgi:hypothetical protein
VSLVKSWSRETFLVAMFVLPSHTFCRLFISPIDITFKNLKDVYLWPRECHAASALPNTFDIAAQKVINAIVGAEDLSGAMHHVATSQPIHAFEAWPFPEIRA